MLEKQKPVDRRKYIRFDTEIRVNFQIQEKRKDNILQGKISGISRNISVEGICFISKKKLKPGSRLELEIFLPSESKPLCLEGDVRWSNPFQSKKGKAMFETGVKLFTFNKDDANKFISNILPEHRRAEDTLRQSEKRLSQIIQGSSIPTFVIDNRRLVTHWNKACESLTGISAKEMIGTRKQWSAFYSKKRPLMTDLIVGEASEKEIAGYYADKYRKSAMIKGAYEAEDFFLHVGKGGKYLFFTAAPLRDLEGKIIGAIETLQDITERKRVEKSLKEAMEVKSQFISMVSHELRTPLTAIKEAIAIVLDGSAGEINGEQKDFLDMAKRNVDRLARLIHNALDFQKLERGKMEFNIRKNDINEVVKDIWRTMSSLAGEEELDFSIRLKDKLPRIKFDKDKITQVLANIVNNAIKFTNKGQVVITTGRGKNMVQVSVRDTGPGIKKKDLSRLFHRFEQLAAPRGGKMGGTGLGLAISKEIVEKHRGKIWAKSKIGKGTTFHFVLPIKEQRG